MVSKKRTFFVSSKRALLKLCVMILTLGISVIASLYDRNSCYATIIVQAINNTYDFWRYVDISKYSTSIVRKATISVVMSIVAILYSFVGIFLQKECMNRTLMKLLGIALVAIPVIFIMIDYRINLEKEK